MSLESYQTGRMAGQRGCAYVGGPDAGELRGLVDGNVEAAVGTPRPLAAAPHPPLPISLPLVVVLLWRGLAGPRGARGRELDEPLLVAQGRPRQVHLVLLRLAIALHAERPTLVKKQEQGRGPSRHLFPTHQSCQCFSSCLQRYGPVCGGAKIPRIGRGGRRRDCSLSLAKGRKAPLLPGGIPPPGPIVLLWRTSEAGQSLLPLLSLSCPHSSFLFVAGSAAVAPIAQSLTSARAMSCPPRATRTGMYTCSSGFSGPACTTPSLPCA